MSKKMKTPTLTNGSKVTIHGIDFEVKKDTFEEYYRLWDQTSNSGPDGQSMIRAMLGYSHSNDEFRKAVRRKAKLKFNGSLTYKTFATQNLVQMTRLVKTLEDMPIKAIVLTDDEGPSGYEVIITSNTVTVGCTCISREFVEETLNHMILLEQATKRK